MTKELQQEFISCMVELYKDGAEFLKKYRIRDNELIFGDIDMPGNTESKYHTPDFQTDLHYQNPDYLECSYRAGKLLD